MFSSGVPVIWKGSPAYEQARIGRLFNHRRPDRYPNGVLEATSVDDVVSGVKLARELGCRVSVRSGGHSWAAWSVRDNAILIDLGKLNFVEVNDAKTIAKVSPSTTGRLLNSCLAAHGKMFAGGHCPDVGLGGFLLQGGMGWNCAVCSLSHMYQVICSLSVRIGVGPVKRCVPLMSLPPKGKFYIVQRTRISIYFGLLEEQVQVCHLITSTDGIYG
jgi:hypothetical protein